jgi:hypothetical protein
MVQGLGTTAFESLSVAAIGDMFFLHERGLRTALLVLTLACLSSFVAIIGGTTFEHLGARTLFVILLPIQIFGALGTILFLPETQYRRVTDATPVASSQAVKEKDGGNVVTEGNQFDEARDSIPKRSFVQDLRVTSGIYSHESLLKLLGEILLHLLNPAVVWVQLVSAVLVVRVPSRFPCPPLSSLALSGLTMPQSFFVGTAYTLAQIFSPPPYNLTVSQNGFFFAGALVGGILGVSAGPLCDVVARTLARRNKGVYEAEFRIPVCALSVVVFAAGWFTFGWALDDGGGQWVVLCSFCYGAVCFGTSVASTSGGLYILFVSPISPVFSPSCFFCYFSLLFIQDS